MPGGFHNRRAQKIVEAALGLALTPAGETALRVWSDLYKRASGTVHGSSVTDEVATALFNELIRATEQVFLPRPDRADRVVALAQLSDPTAADADEVASWSDPIATRYFLAAAISPAWLTLLPETLLLPDAEAWDARPYLDKVGEVAPATLTPWLLEHWGTFLRHPDRVVEAACRLAVPCGIALAAPILALARDNVSTPWLFRALADWVLGVPVDERTNVWCTVAEHLLDAAVERRLDAYTATRLLRAVVDTARRTAPNPLVRMVRNLLSACLNRMLNREPETIGNGLGRGRPHRFALEFVDDLRTVGDGALSFAAPLAHAVLEVAHAEATGGASLADRTAAMRRITCDDVRDRLLAGHLLTTGAYPAPHADTADDRAWWVAAFDVIPRLAPHGDAHQDTAAFLDLAVRACPVEMRPELDAAVARLLGDPPDDRALADGRLRLEALHRGEAGASVPQAWLTVWQWHTLVPDRVLAPWQPALAAMRAVAPAPPEDPRTRTRLKVVAYNRVPAGPLAAASAAADDGGPEQAAGVLADAIDADDTAIDDVREVLRLLLAADGQAWTASPKAVADNLRHRPLVATYLQELRQGRERGHPLDADRLAEAVIASHDFLTRFPDTVDHDTDGLFASTFDLLQNARATDADLGDAAPAIATWIADLARHRTNTTATMLADMGDDATHKALSHPPSRALHTLINDSCRTVGSGLTTELATILETLIREPQPDPRPLALVGITLPILYACDPTWTARYRNILLALPAGAPSPARSWLRWSSRSCPPLLALIDEAELLAELRPCPMWCRGGAV